MRSLLLLTLLFALTACEKEAMEDDRVRPTGKEFPGVTEALWPHFESFELEASERGITINLVESGITGAITDVIGPSHLSGTCFYLDNQPNSIVIDSTIWQGSTLYMHEFIVFHELGHCSLLREHQDSISPKGYCTSIMRSNPGFCVDNYNEHTRGRFLDELFAGR